MKKQTKCKRKDCYWYSKKEKTKCCLDPSGAGWDCVQSGFKEYYIYYMNIAQAGQLYYNKLKNGK